MPAEARDLLAELLAAAASCAHDPLRFVMMAYPWGEAGGPLAKHTGPDVWQAEVLAYIRDNLSRAKPLQIAIAGGVGPGKTTLAAWVADWAMTTFPDCRGRVTANTGPQLSSTTWPELAKWRGMSLFAPWFEFQARSLVSVDPLHRLNWKYDALTWDERKPETFHGFHNAGKRIFTIIDEASSVPDVIVEAAEGFLSDEDTERIWLLLGNPTRSGGRFRMCFPGGKFAGLWKSFKIDTRTTRMANKAQIQQWIDSYGLDSDFVRVRVLSEFPRAGSTQFISSETVELAAAAERDTSGTVYDPLIMGVDVARYGDDKFVIRFRRGRDARTIPPIKFRNIDNMQGAARVAEAYERYRPDMIFIDEGGNGAGVVDRCRYLGLPVTGVSFGAEPDRTQIGQQGAIGYANKRAEMWGSMKEWLSGGMIDDDPELKADLPAVEYGFVLRHGKDVIILEKKEDMKARGLSSPDDGDALALTFAYPVGQIDQSHRFRAAGSSHTYDYDPLAQPPR